MKDSTVPPVQSDTQASRVSNNEKILKKAIGLTDVKTLRTRARQGLEDGAMTAGYKAKVETVLALLNDALATETVCLTVPVAFPE